MVYGIPEAAGASVEKFDKTQYFKCIGCALEGTDNHITNVYQVNGTIYCLRHAQEKHGPQITYSFNQSNTLDV